MAHVDSMDKVIETYFAAVTRETFTYKGKTYEPKPLQIRPHIFRGFTCPAKCGACCPRFSLDYLPEEKKPYDALTKRTVELNGKQYRILSDMQKDHEEHYCRNLDLQTGRCGIHGVHPFSCDFELIRFMISRKDPDAPNRLTQKLYGRKWAMMKVDGTLGTLCAMTPPDADTTSEVVRKLKRLKQWVEHFGLKHCIDEIIAWAETGPHDEPLNLDVTRGRVAARRRIQ